MLPMTLSVAEARSRLSELMRRVEAGESVEIARYNGTPVVRLVPCQPVRPQPLIQGCPAESWRIVRLDEPLSDWEEPE